MTRAELLRRMSADEIADWSAVFELEYEWLHRDDPPSTAVPDGPDETAATASGMGED